MDLLEAWAHFQPKSPPFVLEADKELLTSESSKKAIVIYRSWREAYKAPDFYVPGDTRLHLGLLPGPFIGDIRNASIYILLLNPGVGPDNYYGEYEVPSYHKALISNYKQSFRKDSTPFMCLNTKYSWLRGFDWWHGKLEKVITFLANKWDIAFSEVRRILAKKIASIELLPYHSVAFRDSGRWLRNLPSVALARAFVNDYVVKRVQASKAIAIVTRKVDYWGLPDLPGIIKYSAGEARSAHLTPDSPGGRAIIDHLTRRSF